MVRRKYNDNNYGKKENTYNYYMVYFLIINND